MDLLGYANPKKNKPIINGIFTANKPLWTTFARGVVAGDRANNEKTNNTQWYTKNANINLILNIQTGSYIFPYFSKELFL